MAKCQRQCFLTVLSLCPLILSPLTWLFLSCRLHFLPLAKPSILMLGIGASGEHPQFAAANESVLAVHKTQWQQHVMSRNMPFATEKLVVKLLGFLLPGYERTGFARFCMKGA